METINSIASATDDPNPVANPQSQAHPGEGTQSQVMTVEVPDIANLILASQQFRSNISRILMQDEIKTRLASLKEQGQLPSLTYSVLSTLSSGASVGDAISLIFKMTLGIDVSFHNQSHYDLIQLFTGKAKPQQSDLVSAAASVLLPLFQNR